MASGKRASMREGPLAALFRKTEEEGLEGTDVRAGAAQRQPPAEPPRQAADPRLEELRPAPPSARGEREPDERTVPSATQRLRQVFSSDIPDNIMELAPSEPAPRYG